MASIELNVLSSPGPAGFKNVGLGVNTFCDVSASGRCDLRVLGFLDEAAVLDAFAPCSMPDDKKRCKLILTGGIHWRGSACLKICSVTVGILHDASNSGASRVSTGMSRDPD